MSKVISLGNEEDPTFEELQEKINTERKALQERVNNNAEILKVLFDYQCKEARVFNQEGVQMILPIEKLEMVIKDLNDLKEWIKMYDTIEDFLYQ
ncbi:hypothetical protein [Vagococcus fluvialis]|uniref:hypothetical protein n=1 Tax=Vagococcus fluvialis TaxID=2738 RepID=UPI00143313D3|nr:hypothetical protein [Vagococcus fluvialis]NKC58917.1 hypothetical protein [Vagococcus fluvialis]NKD49672.1 hypothetical protein [Vagococcus fluvialis]WNF89831.1 hypothetical protein QDW48_11955 [Vagococcus fluvialis]